MEIIKELLEKTSWKVIATVTSILILYIIKIILNRIVDKKVDHFRKRYFFRQSVNYLFWFLLATISVFIWVDWFRSALTMLSLVIGALVITAKEAVLNLIANSVIIWRGIFQVGDRIEIDGIIGDVIEAGPMYFSLAEHGNGISKDGATGRIVKIPNSFLLYKPTWNYSRGVNVVWNELSFEIKKESDFESVNSKVLEILNNISYKFTPEQIKELIESSTDIMFLNKEPEIFVKIEPEKILLTVRYLTKFHKKRETENEFWILLLQNIKDDLK